MKIVDRYISRQVLVSTFFGVTALSTVLVLGNILRKMLDLMVNHDVPMDVFMKFMGFLIPFSLTFTIPWGFVTAVLLVMGRLSAENELIALRTAGLSIPRISISILGMSLIFSGICYWLNSDVAPKARGALTSVVYDIATKTPQALFESDRVIAELPDRRIYVGDKREDGLHDITVFEIDENKDPVRVIFARRGELRPDPVKKSLGLVLHEAVIEQWADPGDPKSARGGISVQNADTVISLEELFERGQKKGGVGAIATPRLVRMLHEPDVPKKLEIEGEIHRRIASSLACFAFALVGIPLAITAQRKETTVGFGLSLVVAFSYHLLITIASHFQDKPEAHPILLTWGSNIIFLSLGAVLFWRLSRK